MTIYCIVEIIYRCVSKMHDNNKLEIRREGILSKLNMFTINPKATTKIMENI